jgi:hypothetical protein
VPFFHPADGAPHRFSIDAETGALFARSFSSHSFGSLLDAEKKGGRRKMIDTDAIMRRREFGKRISVQIWLSSLAPILQCLGACFYDARAGAPLQLHRLLCGGLSVALLALATLKQARAWLPPRWAPDAEALMKTLVQMEVRGGCRQAPSWLARASPAAPEAPAGLRGRLFVIRCH